MKKYIFFALSVFLTALAYAQDDVYPAPANKGVFYIKNATIHTGTGQVISQGIVKVNNDKIEQVGTGIAIPGDAKVVDAQGKHVYPGLILSISQLGIQEIAGNAVKGSNDFSEIGDYNTNIRSITAYNADSRITGTLRANGILLANVVPQGGLLPGLSSVVQADAWSPLDAAYKKDVALHFNMPSLLTRSRFGGGGGFQRQPAEDPVKQALARVEEVKNFFREAKAYLAETSHKETNLKFEALRPLFEKKQKFFVHCNIVKQMLIAIDFAKEFGFDVVIVGGSDSWQIAGLLKQNNIAVLLGAEHSLPTAEDDDIDQPFKTPAMLQQAGVLFAMYDDDETTRYRNLPFNVGTAISYGLDKEEALKAVTLNAARILGIDDRTGSIEAGKDANLVICQGDIFDMRSSIVTDAFIQGRKVSLENKQTQLYERYKHKYGLQ